MSDAPRTTADAAGSSYYGVPVVHKPHWKWLIIVYFFLGGIAGGSYVLATIADALDPRGNRPIVRAGRYLSFAALLPCPVLLILDLGRPERFYMMLRVLKLRSPMSLGTWALVVFGGFSAFSAGAQAADDGLLGRRVAAHAPTTGAMRRASSIGSPFALFVAGYTGVLLAATAVPIWTKRALLLGPLFLASAVSTSASAIALALPHQGRPAADAHDRLERLENLAALVELGLVAAWLRGLGSTGRPLAVGPTGAAFRHASVNAGLVAPLLLRRWRGAGPGRHRELIGYVASFLTLSGGFALRYAVVVAGHASADDPQATFALTAAPIMAPAPLEETTARP